MSQVDDRPSSLPPDAIGDYRIVSALSESAYRALGPGDRSVILKLLDADCLQRGKLHPNIHLRLSRVRELAHPAVANLHAVERDAGYVFAVWDDVPGLPIDRYVQTQKPSALAIARMARELILVVESLHALGIVHGRIDAGNVIVDPQGNIRLTHISPLLYDDPAVDRAATIDLLRRIMQIAGQGETALGRAVEETAAGNLPLRTLSARLSVSVDSTPAGSDPAPADSDSGLRWMTLALAIGVAVIGVGLAWIIVRLVK